MIPVRVSFWYELSISYRVYMDDTNIDTENNNGVQLSTAIRNTTHASIVPVHHDLTTRTGMGVNVAFT